MAHTKPHSRRAHGSPTLSCDARVAVPGPTGTKNTDVDGKLTQLHRRVFAPRNKEKTLPLGDVRVGSSRATIVLFKSFWCFWVDGVGGGSHETLLAETGAGNGPCP